MLAPHRGAQFPAYGVPSVACRGLVDIVIGEVFWKYDRARFFSAVMGSVGVKNRVTIATHQGVRSNSAVALLGLTVPC